MKMNVVATNALDELCRSPHADTPAVPIVLADFFIPLKGLLSGDLPEIPSAPLLRLPVWFIEELRADPVRCIVVALVVAIARALSRADINLLLRNHLETLSCLQEAASQHDTHHHHEGIEVLGRFFDSELL